MLTTKAFAQWSALAQRIERRDNPLNVPFEVALDEAVRLAAYVGFYWEPAEGRPGLVHVEGRIPPDTAERLVSLVGAIHEAHTRWLLVLPPRPDASLQRARAVLRELSAVLRFVLDETEAPTRRLARADKALRRGPDNPVLLSQALDTHVVIARSLEKRIAAADATFDPALVDEAARLSEALMHKGTKRPRTTAEGDTALVLRNRLLVLLTNEVAEVRRAAAHVFREHPDIVRELTSAYERRRRATARKGKRAAPTGSSPSPPPQ